MKIPGIPTERLSKIFSSKTNLYFVSETFTVKAIKRRDSDVNRMALIAGKKALSKSAVIRNRADRRIKSALQSVYPNLKVKGYDFVFFLLPPIITTPWLSLTKQVTRTLQKMESKAEKYSNK